MKTLLFLLPALGLPAAGLTVRVQPTPGGPQIHVDGEPVPPRFFWGAMSGGVLQIAEQWADYSFEFRPGINVVRQGTLHFRFGHLAGQVELAEVRVRDRETNEEILPPGSLADTPSFAKTWNIWPPGQENTVGKWELTNGVLRVSLTDPPGGAWPDFHFHSQPTLSFRADRAYRCTFRARSSPGRVIYPAVYQVANGSWTSIGGPPGPFLSQVALARDAGVNLVSFAAPECWGPPGTPNDWTPLDNLCRQIIAVHPKVLLVPRVGADAPDWWLQSHPQARMVYEVDQPGRKSCVSDRAYRADAAAHLRKLCRHLCETFPNHFAGIHPCGQNTGEWFYENSWLHPLSGYDPATLTAWRAWLKARGDRNADTAAVPSPVERRAHPFGLLRNPAREMRLLEFARFQQREMADHVLALAAACREGTEGKKLVIFFFGYLFEFGPLQNGAPASGHYELSRVLAGKNIDILCSPISYTDRDWLGTAPCMSPAESVREAGILWLNEDDSRTFLDPRRQEHAQEGGLVDLKQTRQVMLRNTAQEALRGFGSWWMDLPAQGWFNDARIWEEMVRLHSVDAFMIKRPRPFTPDVAAVVDEDSMCHLAGGSAVAARPLIYDARAEFGRLGTPYGQYSLRDVIARRVPAKLQVFLSAWALSPEQRKALASSRSPGTSRIWCWAPGYIYPDRQDPSGIAEVTGFVAHPVSLPTAEVTPTQVGAQQGLLHAWGPKVAIQPLFAVEARPEEIWATFSDGSAAVAVRRTTLGMDVFVGTPQLRTELLRALAKLSGVHLLTGSEATVWAAEGFLSLQAHRAGPLTLDLGQAATVRDALDGDVVGHGPQITIPFEQGEVRVLRY